MSLQPITLSVARHLAHYVPSKSGGNKSFVQRMLDIRSSARIRRDVRQRDAKDHRELLLASELQSELLPALHPPEAGIDLGARSVAAWIVGGDFYDFFRYPGKAISAEAVGDVSGKGAAATIYAGLATGILRSLAPLELGPAEMLFRLNKALLKRRFEDGTSR
jgi:sigma-B regulation protein RsbU (phosphoserine phosphatase)